MRKEVSEVALPVSDKAEEIEIMRASFLLIHTILNCWRVVKSSNTRPSRSESWFCSKPLVCGPLGHEDALEVLQTKGKNLQGCS